MANGWARSPRRGIRVARQRRIKICFDKADYLCRPVKIRVVATPTNPMAPRKLQAFPAGIPLNETLEVLIVMELPGPSSLPASDVREPIDWRICGEQDAEPESQSNE
jgi:hypothetical protein